MDEGMDERIWSEPPESQQTISSNVHPPEMIKMGKRVFYSFDLINV